MAKFSAVLFDFDGTLVETHDYILGAYNHALTSNGKPAVDMAFLSKWAGVPLEGVFRGIGFSEKEVESVTQSFYEFQKANLQLVKAFPESKAVLQELEKRGIKVGIVTARKTRSTKMMLTHTGLGEFVKELIAPDNFSKNKPEPEPFLECARLLGVTAKECLVVGDGCADIKGGRAAGMKTALAGYGYGAAHGCDTKADFVLKSVGEVLELI